MVPAFISAMRMTTDHFTPDWLMYAYGGFLVVGIGYWCLVMTRGRTLADQHGITVQRALTRRTLSWHEIYDIRVQFIPKAAGNARKCLAHAYTDDGRRTLLPHVDDWQLPNPVAEIEALRLAATEQWGAVWATRPEVEERILLAAAQRKRRERISVVVVITLVVGLMAWGVVYISSH
ncbi:hypothetical protein WN71_026775 [Streptomyces mangrovisoli]|uniref:Low molecular weight protein antigen 6 PH domain-containing protein n=2 Tax=Streptomyces mangrovisoli TaxID=1428628 RepID=A0A1J4NU79_9ACTN|nr:hypothetical protein WN71_026775 [Streptomyces mangrovisoli]